MRFLLILAATLLLAGCSTLAALTTPVAKPTTYANEDAAKIASLIHGCSSVSALDIGNGGLTGLASLASCTLGGHSVLVSSYSSHDHADLGPLMQATGDETYYVQGDTWAVQLNDSGSGGTAGNLDAEKTMTETTVKSIGGTVKHYKP
jgi:uncharacterized protein YceK